MKYGLIGEHLSHSISPILQKHLGLQEYTKVEVQKEDLVSFLKNRDFKGINVTIPYKELVIPYLDELDPVAKSVGAVNTVLNKDGKLVGYNTDYFGLEYLLLQKEHGIKGLTVAILGSGGTSKTAVEVLKHLEAKEILVVSRTPKENQISYLDLQTKYSYIDVLINTTPVGMYPKYDEVPVDLDDFPHLTFVVDVVYNPYRTKLCLEAKKRGITYQSGLEMLAIQGIYANQLFISASTTIVDAKQLQPLTKNLQNEILIGMPGVGKSTYGAFFAKSSGKDFVDLDHEIEKRNGIVTSKYIEEFGEEAFRVLESKTLKELFVERSEKQNRMVLACGGGTILKEENQTLLKQLGHIVYLQSSGKRLSFSNRPLSHNLEEWGKRLQERKAIYEEIADETIPLDGNIRAVIKPSKLKGDYTVPGSKSLAHRYLLLACFATGETIIHNLPKCDDVDHTIECIKTLGAQVENRLDGICVRGIGCLPKSEYQLNVGESATTLRLLLPSLLNNSKVHLITEGSLKQRLQQVYEELFEKEGIYSKRIEGEWDVCGTLTQDTYTIEGNSSSQYISGLLIALSQKPFISTITLTTSLESRPYIELTMEALRDFGVEVTFDGTTFYIYGKEQLQSPGEVYLEGDWSQASFFECLNHEGSDICLFGLNNQSKQGDQEILNALNTKDVVSIKDTPDLGPMLMAYFARHGGRMKEYLRLALKESNRVEAMREELTKCGVEMIETNGTITFKGTLRKPEQPLSSHGDHRIVHALTYIGLLFGCEIDDVYCVGKSDHRFFESLVDLGANIQLEFRE